MKSISTSRLPSLILFALFVCALLLALVSGIRIYSSLVDEQNEAEQMRFANGLIVNSVKSMDAYGSVESGIGPEGESLILVQHLEGGVFETRFYGYRGNVVMEYTSSENEIDPDNATKILESDTFEFEISKGLLTVSTDEGDTDVALRSGDPVI